MTVLAELDVNVLHVIAELSELLNLVAHVFFQAFGDLDIAAVDVDFHDHSLQVGGLYRVRLDPVRGIRLRCRSLTHILVRNMPYITVCDKYLAQIIVTRPSANFKS